MASSARSRRTERRDPSGPATRRGREAGRTVRDPSRDARPASSEIDHAIEACLDRASVRRGERLCVALSAGCDSTVLLHALARIAPARGLALRALHVHHGLSPDASRWAARARALCATLGVPCSVSRVQVARDSGLGIEAAARAARHAVFMRQATDWIVLGHHQDDQAETVLLQLLRGAGARGLAAMPEVHAQRRWLRPLLDLSRVALERHAREHGLDWVEDESNASEAFDRNFLRLRALPLLRERFPGASGALARSARLLAEADALAREVGAADLAAARSADGSVSVGALAALGAARARALLRVWLESAGESMPSERRLAEALRQAVDAGGDARVEVPLGALALRRWRDRLWLLPVLREKDPSPHRVRPWNRRARMRLGEAGVLLMRRSSGEGLSARWLREHPLAIMLGRDDRGVAPRIAIGDPPRHRTLRNLWQEAAVPPWLRSRWPLLEHAGRLVCVPGIAVASEASARPGEAGRVFEWRPD